MSQDVSKVPFDLRSYRILEYGTKFDEFADAKARLTEHARKMADNGNGRSAARSLTSVHSTTLVKETLPGTASRLSLSRCPVKRERSSKRLSPVMEPS